MSLKPSNSFLLIIIAMFFGAISGVLSVIIIGAGNFRLPFIGQINYADSDRGGNIVIEQPRSVIVEQDTQVRQVENDLLPAVINIYHAKNTADPLSAAYSDREILGRGFVLTADGWIVTTQGAIDDLRGKYAAVGYQNKKYAITGLIQDKATGLVFGKMAGANLPVARLGRSKDLHLGQTVAVVTGRTRLALTNISQIGYVFPQGKDLVLSSDLPEKRIYFSAVLGAGSEGSLVANLKGEVIGVVAGGAAVPVDHFSRLVGGVLKSQKISRASLGVDYIDLAQASGLIDWGDKGAYVAYEPLKGSAAYGVIKKGDIIKKLNDAELNAFAGLADVVNEMQPADKTELTVLRNGQETTVTATLK